MQELWFHRINADENKKKVDEGESIPVGDKKNLITPTIDWMEIFQHTFLQISLQTSLPDLKSYPVWVESSYYVN